jgi:hypothetical protein
MSAALYVFYISMVETLFSGCILKLIDGLSGANSVQALKMGIVWTIIIQGFATRFLYCHVKMRHSFYTRSRHVRYRWIMLRSNGSKKSISLS